MWAVDNNKCTEKQQIYASEYLRVSQVSKVSCKLKWLFIWIHRCLHEPHIHHVHRHTHIYTLATSCRSVSAPGQSFHATFPPIPQTSTTNPSFWTRVHTDAHVHSLSCVAVGHHVSPHPNRSVPWPVGGLTMLPTGPGQETAARPDKTPGHTRWQSI